MIHAIGEQLQSALAAAGIPLPVIDGPERRPTTTFARERVVLEHDGEDTVIPKRRTGATNPEIRFTRVCQYKATLYVQNPSKGSAEFEHRRRAEALLDQVIIALDTIVKDRQNVLTFKSGKFVIPDDMKAAETLGGAVYELTFTIDRGVTTAPWSGQAAPQVAIPNGMITNQTQVTVDGQGTPEVACG